MSKLKVRFKTGFYLKKKELQIPDFLPFLKQYDAIFEKG